MSWHARLPWRSVRVGLRLIRAGPFSRRRPEGTYLLVDAPTDGVDSVTEVLGSQSYAPNWEQSYDKGEDLNLARVEHHRDGDLPPTERRPGRVWWQTHARGWETERGLELGAHWELEPTENAEEHIMGRGLDRREGMERLRADLERGGIDVETVEYER